MENHFITMENQGRVTITAVKDIDAFDEDAILINLQDNGLVIKGEKLNIEKLDLDEGKLVAVGKILLISYTEKKQKQKRSNGNIISKLIGKGHKK
jgi:sporulation protein YabP